MRCLNCDTEMMNYDVITRSAKLSYDVCENAAVFGSIAASWTKWHSNLPVRLSSARKKKPILPRDHREPVPGVTMFSSHPFDSLVKAISFWITAGIAADSGSTAVS